MRFFKKSFGVDELSGGSVGWNKQSLFAPGCQASFLQREYEADPFSWFMEALMQDLTL